MAKGKKKTTSASTSDKRGFYDKLVLNLFMIQLFGIDVLSEQYVQGKSGHKKRVRPFRKLSERLENCSLDGLADDGLHHYYHELAEGDFFGWPECRISQEMLLQYEKNIVQHTEKINSSRTDAIRWKYYQWMTLLFVEIYLDRYFGNRAKLQADLNSFVDKFNQVYEEKGLRVTPYKDSDLNKLCLQNATGSGKTLLMTANYWQYRYYEKKYNTINRDNGLTILLTPNERLSTQDADEFNKSGHYCVPYSKGAGDGSAIYTLEVQKLAEKDGDKSVSAAALGDRNLLFIDEGHAGLSGKEAGAWYSYRSMMCAKGFAFEYSATFKQAVEGTLLEDEYARAILFDYSYRWFYEDGYGKDYQIFNLPESKGSAIQNNSQLDMYLTASMLKYFQQLLIYGDKKQEIKPFNIEKPLWVWVGHSVAGKSKEDSVALSDIARILKFLAEFLKHPDIFQQRIVDLLTKNGAETGLMDDKGYDLFHEAFYHLKQFKNKNNDMTGAIIYDKIMRDLFQTSGRGGHLVMERLKGDTGEILLKVSNSTVYFGEINVSGASELCTSLAKNGELTELLEVRAEGNTALPMFDSIKNSDSTINLLIGAKKFAEGWDCWRVSVLGLLNVGKTEGTQIIQLFGRGVRLKGYQWSLKRSNHISNVSSRPDGLTELELLCVFGVSADAMVSFKNYLKAEELPGNEQRNVITVPMSVCQLDNKKLKVLCPKQRKDNGREYNFKTDGPVPCISGDIPDIIVKNPIVLDWYPRIQAMVSDGDNAQVYQANVKYSDGNLRHLLDFLDFDELYFAAEHWKRRNAKYNYNCSQEGIVALFHETDWYKLLIPKSKLTPQNYQDIQEIQDIANTLLEKYLKKFYDESNNAYMKPRLEYRILDAANANIPEEQEYQIIFDESDESLETSLKQILADLQKSGLGELNNIGAIEFSGHLFNPIFMSENNKVKILPCMLNTSEFRFVKHLAEFQKNHGTTLKENWDNIYLLRNQSRGKGMGFFEAANFYPDFILWCVKDNKQFISFVEPHGLKNEGKASPKVQFYKTIKDIQARLKDPDVILNSFILSPTAFSHLQWGVSQKELKSMHILFQEDNNGDAYIAELFEELAKEMPVHVRSSKPMQSRPVYHMALLAEMLKTGDGNTLSLEELVAGWAILNKAEAVAEALPDRADIKSWLGNYPDWIKDSEAMVPVLRGMIERHMISIGKDLKVTLINDFCGSDDVKMDSKYAIEAIRLLHAVHPKHFCFQTFNSFIPVDFLNAAKKGEFAYAA